MMLRVVGRLGTFSGHPMLDHFRFVKEHTRVDAEDDHPVAVVAAFSLWPRRHSGIDLSRHGRFFGDLGQTYAKAVRAFADAGCRYLQLDEVNFTYLCDPKLRDR